MSREYVIITDSTNDMPKGFAKEHGVDIIPIIYEIDGEVYGKDKELSAKEFYDRMRQNSVTKTAAPNITDISEHFEAVLSQGKDILFTCLSSGISSTLNNAYIVQEEMQEKYPDADICVFDSLCACGGQGLLLYWAIANKEKGMSARENMMALEDIKMHIVHKFTVEDLVYLQRGGRISKAAAVIGSMIQLKPVLHVDDEGFLVAETKVRGRKKSLNQLVTGMDECVGSYADKQEAVVICHADCAEDAEYVRKIVEEKYHPKKIFMSEVSPTIGAHSGPGTMTLFFMGDKR
ncbi:MAG: DegV family protein [Wujia sp.]